MKNLKKAILTAAILMTVPAVAQEESSDSAKSENAAWSQVTGMFRGADHMILVQELPVNKDIVSNEYKVAKRVDAKVESNRQAKVEVKADSEEETAP